MPMVPISAQSLFDAKLGVIAPPDDPEAKVIGILATVGPQTDGPSPDHGKQFLIPITSWVDVEQLVSGVLKLATHLWGPPANAFTIEAEFVTDGGDDTPETRH